MRFGDPGDPFLGHPLYPNFTRFTQTSSFVSGKERGLCDKCFSPVLSVLRAGHSRPVNTGMR